MARCKTHTPAVIWNVKHDTAIENPKKTLWTEGFLDDINERKKSEWQNHRNFEDRYGVGGPIAQRSAFREQMEHPWRVMSAYLSRWSL